ncbi:ABC transporter permease [Haloferax sp. DFSO52]|uniref:ABC transporter permease n=1 Tax=Haloferax sp. DFSO52 TaxID=3388505 RepID=UPI003A89204A
MGVNSDQAGGSDTSSLVSEFTVRVRNHRFGRLAVTMLPATGWLTVFLLLPLTVMLYFSLGQVGGYGTFYLALEDLGIHQYTRFFLPDETGVSGSILLTGGWLLEQLFPVDVVTGEPTAYVKLLFKSLWFGVQTTVVTLAIGYPLAYFIARIAPEKYRDVLLVAVVLPFWASFLARVYAIKILLSQNSILMRVLGSLPGVPQSISLMNSQEAVLFGLVYMWLPFMVLPIYTDLERFDFRLHEAAMDLGADRIAAFRYVTLPRSKQGIVTGTSLVFIIASGSYVIPELLGGPNSQMIGNLIAHEFGAAGNWPFGAAVSFVMMTVILLLTLGYYWAITGGEA